MLATSVDTHSTHSAEAPEHMPVLQTEWSRSIPAADRAALCEYCCATEMLGAGRLRRLFIMMRDQRLDPLEESASFRGAPFGCDTVPAGPAATAADMPIIDAARLPLLALAWMAGLGAADAAPPGQGRAGACKVDTLGLEASVRPASAEREFPAQDGRDTAGGRCVRCAGDLAERTAAALAAPPLAALPPLELLPIPLRLLLMVCLARPCAQPAPSG